MIGFVHMFAKHRVAANLLMVIMIIAGAIGVDRLRTQFFPTFELDIITVSVAWSGATAEDVQEGLTIPIENAIEELAFIESIDATSQFGSASFRIELIEGTNLSQATRRYQPTNRPEPGSTRGCRRPNGFIAHAL